MPETIASFMTAVHRTVREVTSREPGWFAARPLRVCAPPFGAAEAVAAAFGIRIEESGPDLFTAVDDLLDRRRVVAAPGPWEVRDQSPGRDQSRDRDGSGGMDRSGGMDWVSWRRDRDRHEALRAARAAHLAEVMDRRTAGRVRYRTGGRGPALVLLTAVGHAAEIWWPLAERLLPDRRLLLWDSAEDDPESLLADMDAVLAAEAPDGCDVLAWCSGAQLAVEYAATRPGSVRSAVLLHGSFPRGPGEPGTAYERNLAAVCATVATRPERAERSLRLISGNNGPAGTTGGNNSPAATTGGDDGPAGIPEDEARAAAEVLSRPPPGWDAALRRPFRDARAFAAYSRQLTALWRRRLPQPWPGRPPMLALTAELDRIAAPSLPAALRPLLTGAGRLAGAAHWSMLDRPGVVARACRDFFADPVGGLPAAGRAELCRPEPAAVHDDPVTIEE
ncbi:alpha/beta hydrolase [Actinoplanes missouriensis]|uniref:alpha/beta fold hydrolase n=1 Tax=Actinoplanes missouriensis TaxID=1866 RepID=UPI00340FC5DE